MPQDKPVNPISKTIESAIDVMSRLLTQAARDTLEAYEHMRNSEQNLAIGTIITIEDALDAVTALYKSVMHLHRIKR